MGAEVGGGVCRSGQNSQIAFGETTIQRICRVANLLSGKLFPEFSVKLSFGKHFVRQNCFRWNFQSPGLPFPPQVVRRNQATRIYSDSNKKNNLTKEQWLIYPTVNLLRIFTFYLQPIVVISISKCNYGWSVELTAFGTIYSWILCLFATHYIWCGNYSYFHHHLVILQRKNLEIEKFLIKKIK